MHRLIVVLTFFVLWGGAFPAHAGTLSVYASVLPQKYFLEKIGGDLIDASVMVMPGASPATYEPSPRQMVGLTKASGYFTPGVPFETGWLSRIKAANSDLVIIQTDVGVTKKPMESHDHDGHDADYDDGVLDPHIWLSPELVKTIAANTCAGLVRLDPENKAAYEANLNIFMSEIEALDGEIKATLAVVPEGRRSFMVFHPSWGYFAEQYGLRQIPIESEGKEPSPRELMEIIEHGRELGIAVVFAQPQFSDKSARVIAAEIGARVMPLDSLAENWSENLRNAAKGFQQELR